MSSYYYLHPAITGFLVVLVGIAAAIGLWLMIRTLVLWYFRIDRIIELLEKIAGEERQRPTLHMTESGEITEDTIVYHH